MTLDIAARTLFGTDVGDQAQAIAHALEVAQHNFLLRFNSVLQMPMWVPTPANLPQMHRAVERLDQVVYTIIREHRARRPSKAICCRCFCKPATRMAAS